jgi:hypothetical protein
MASSFELMIICVYKTRRERENERLKIREREREMALENEFGV